MKVGDFFMTIMGGGYGQDESLPFIGAVEAAHFFMKDKKCEDM